MSGTKRHGIVAATAVAAGLSMGVVGGGMLNGVAAIAETSTEEAAERVALSTVTVSSSLTYNGEDQFEKLKVTVKDVDGNEVDAAEYDIATNPAQVTGAGNYTVTVTAKADSKVVEGTASSTFKVKKKEATVTAKNQNITKGTARPDLNPAKDATVRGVIGSDELDFELEIKDANIDKVGTYDIVVTDNGNANYEIKATNGTLTVVDPKSPFIDTPSGTPHRDDIIALYTKKIAAGWSTDAGLEYRPLNKIARQDMAAFLFRVCNPNTDIESVKLDADFENFFCDVDENTPHYKEILWCAEHGITTGWGTGTKREFRGSEAVLRQDMAAFLSRAAKEMDNELTGTTEPFDDVDNDTPHHEDIAKIADAQIAKGWKMDDGTTQFRGDQPVIRQDMAAFLIRLQDACSKPAAQAEE